MTDIDNTLHQTKKIVQDQNEILLQKIRKFHDQLYTQLESLLWLQRRLSLNGQLPPLRRWTASPDVLLRLHSHIMTTKPTMIVELGSGASTLVIADAVRQNRLGRLVSIDHSEYFGMQTLQALEAENLDRWVDLRIGALEPWINEHASSTDKHSGVWYPKSLFSDLVNINLLWVDGPPGAICPLSRYPALPMLVEQLAPNAQIWLDDAIRTDEKIIAKRWAMNYELELSFYSLDKGLACLTLPSCQRRLKSDPLSSESSE